MLTYIHINLCMYTQCDLENLIDMKILLFIINISENFYLDQFSKYSNLNKFFHVANISNNKNFSHQLNFLY